jgi:FtsZ-binding cell division protein ZapB
MYVSTAEAAKVQALEEAVTVTSAAAVEVAKLQERHATLAVETADWRHKCEAVSAKAEAAAAEVSSNAHFSN